MKPAALLLPLCAMLLGGCAGMRERAPELPTVTPGPQAPATAGAIYRNGAGLSLFQDIKARQPGDVLTILLSESTQASSSAATKVNKEDSASLDLPSLFGGPVTLHGREILDTSVTAKRKFSGDGDSAQSNKLTGSLTVTVVERLPNGNLVVQGEKQLKLNQGDEVVRIRGVIRPADIAPDNTVASSRVADAKIVYTGRGSLGNANTQGWLSRFLNSRWMPF